MSQKLLAVVAIFIAALFWSSAGAVTKILFLSFDQFPLAFLRFLIAGLVILPFLYSRPIPSKKILLTKFMPVMVFSILNIFFFYLGIAKTTANASTIIYTTTPLFVSVIARKIFQEKFPIYKVMGLIIGFLGVLIVILLPLLENKAIITGDLSGNLILLAGAFSWAWYTIGSQKLNSQYSSITVTGVSIITSCLVFGGISFITPHRNFITPLFNSNNLLLLFYLAIFVTVITFLSFQWAIKHSSASLASMTNYVQPIFGMIINWIFLGEKLTVGFIVGSILAVGGVILATLGKERK
jgi:drug/metabolite transporter (DMT)-like permease